MHEEELKRERLKVEHMEKRLKLIMEENKILKSLLLDQRGGATASHSVHPHGSSTAATAAAAATITTTTTSTLPTQPAEHKTAATTTTNFNKAALSLNIAGGASSSEQFYSIDEDNGDEPQKPSVDPVNK
jgi:hypothetical protein